MARRNGSSVRAITSGPSDARPSWSPDGRRLAFVRDGMISVVSASGGPVTTVIAGTDPEWSPDGTRIAFAVATGVATAAVDGTDVRIVTLDAGSTSPVFSPDMSKVVAVRRATSLRTRPTGRPARSA